MKNKSEEDLIVKNLLNNNIENAKIFQRYETINPINDYAKIDLIVMINNNFKRINSVIKIKGKIYMTSLYSKDIFIWEKNKYYFFLK